MMTGKVCTAVVRVPYTTRRIAGWQLACGAAGVSDEATARTAFGPFVPSGPGPGATGYRWIATKPPEPWILYGDPGDFGGIAIGSSRTGALAMAGGIVWAGRGELTYPGTWRSYSELREVCAEYSHDAVRGFIPPAAGTEINDGRDAAVGVVFRTALPHAMARSRAVDGAWVLGYPRTVGMFDPEEADWIVFVEAVAK